MTMVTAMFFNRNCDEVLTLVHGVSFADVTSKAGRQISDSNLVQGS